MAEGAVVANDLTIAYPAAHGSPRFDAVRGIDLRIEPGELVGVVGESGAGKSTLARMLAGHGGRAGAPGPRIAGGTLAVLGQRVGHTVRRVRRMLGAQVGYLPQQAGRALAPDRTVIENVTAPLYERDRRFDAREAGVRAAELIDAVQLPLGIMNRYPWELSGGQRQRVAIARSLILQPRLWIADEPTTGVDVLTRGPILDTLLELHAERVFSALIVSHDAAVMTRTTDRILVLQRGIVVGSGHADTVLADPMHPYVRGLRDDYLLRTGVITVPQPS